MLKSPGAARYWSNIGSTIRYTYGGIISSTPSNIADKGWDELPLGIRSRLSREMNRLQNRRNRTVKPLSQNDRKFYRIRWDSAIRRPEAPITTWQRLYHTEVDKQKSKYVRKLITSAPKQKLIIQDQ